MPMVALPNALRAVPEARVMLALLVMGAELAKVVTEFTVRV